MARAKLHPKELCLMGGIPGRGTARYKDWDRNFVELCRPDPVADHLL